VAFESNATNLVDGDTNRGWDVFLRDRVAGTTELVSVATSGALGDGRSQDPHVSPNGRFVVFESLASNLVDGDTNGVWDVFVRDRSLGVTYRVSIGPGGVQSNGASRDPAISSGRYVAYQSTADNLVSGDTNRRADIFLYDHRTNSSRRVNAPTSGPQAIGGTSHNPAISKNGRFVAFDSKARNLVRGDSNGTSDVFVRDMKTRTMERVSVGAGGRQANGASKDATLSENGRRVSFQSEASNLVSGDSNGGMDVFVHDRGDGRTIRASVRSNGKQSTGGSSHDAALSGDGKFVAFESSATNLVRNDTNGFEDIFRHGQLR
jgi:Tol biopolymer transport system component